jgi:hypothetical protein
MEDELTATRLTFRAPLCLMSVVLTSSCVVISSTSIQTMTPRQAVGTKVGTPVKVFHADGSITVFADGARVTDTSVLGFGSHYSLDLTSSGRVEAVALDSLVGVEVFRGGVHRVATVLTSAAATGSVYLIVLGAALAHSGGFAATPSPGR